MRCLVIRTNDQNFGTSTTELRSYIEDLDLDLLKNKAILNRIDHWCRTLNWCNGWHYDLDIVWIVNQLRKWKVEPGSTILDAGAGLGITQFVLASMGFNVISLDYGDREVPKYAKDIFAITKSKKVGDIPDTVYGNFMTFNRQNEKPEKVARSIRRYFRRPTVLYSRSREWVRAKLNVNHYIERMRDHSDFGSIEFIRASFNEMPLTDECVDAVVSISAFEHNEYDQMGTAAKEFIRVCRKGGPILVTTSRSSDKDWYFEPCKGWNLTAESLGKWFGVDDIRCREFSKVLSDVRGSSKLASRIGTFYKLSGNNGLPYGDLASAQYTPIGVCVTKQ